MLGINMSKEKFNKFITALVNDLAIAEELLREEPDLIYVKNGIGETVLHYLAVENELELVRWLHNKGSDLNTTNEFGNTPLSAAAGLGNLEICEYLLDAGASHKICTPDGDSALSEAAVNNNTEVVSLLLTHISPCEKIRGYFSEVTYEVLLDKECESAKLIYNKGLNW
jgi:ankyrin repeat protein